MRLRTLLARLGAVVATLGAVCTAAPAASADDSVTPLCNGQACSSAWYTSAVAVTWSVSTTPPPDHTVDCAGVQPTSHDLVATTSCEAIWTGLDDIKRAYTVHVELSPPTALATLSRAPDSNGWFNHPVAVTFTGASFSGISSCMAPTAYAGPSVLNTMVSGSCTDNAGKTANASVSLNYDATPPTITGATPSRPPDTTGGYYTHPVSLHFTGTDAVSGIAGCDTVTYGGPSSGSVLGGCHDQAGNYATRTVDIRYRAPTPRASITRARSSLTLRWRPAARASYYNIQVYRNGRKVLSSWPSRTSLMLRRSWSFGGNRFRLKPGRYRWYVWPGYGSRAAARYGAVLVSATFRVTKSF